MSVYFLALISLPSEAHLSLHGKFPWQSFCQQYSPFGLSNPTQNGSSMASKKANCYWKCLFSKIYCLTSHYLHCFILFVSFILNQGSIGLMASCHGVIKVEFYICIWSVILVADLHVTLLIGPPFAKFYCEIMSVLVKFWSSMTLRILSYRCFACWTDNQTGTALSSLHCNSFPPNQWFCCSKGRCCSRNPCY